MVEDAFYERYWKQQNIGKVASVPPQRSKEELEKIKLMIAPYVYGKGLDVGCGDGSLTSCLKTLGNIKEIIGLDISPTAILGAKKKYPQISFKVGLVTKIPLSNKKFDFIVASEIVEHILDTESMFAEFNRVLKKKGRLVITTVDFNLLKKIIIGLFFWEKYFYPSNPHVRFFTKSTLREMLERFGFKVIEYWWNGSYFKIMPKGQTVVAEKIKELY